MKKTFVALFFVFFFCLFTGVVFYTQNNNLSGGGYLEFSQPDKDNADDELYSSSTISNAEVEGWYFTYDSSTGKYKTSTDVYAWDEEAVATIAFNSSASTTITVNLEIWGDVVQSSIQYTELDNCMSIAGSLNPGGTVQGGTFSKTVTYSVSAGYHFFQIKYLTGKGKGGTNAMFKLPFTATNTLFEGDSCPTVSFSSDGTIVMKKPVPVGGTYGILPTATKSGYYFDGWYTSATGGTKVSSTTRITSHTLYAQFSNSGYVISLTGDVGIASLSGGGVYSGGTAVTIKATVKAGYTFAGWSDGNKNLSRTITVTASATYRATTTANKYTVTMDPNGGSFPPTYSGSGNIASTTYITENQYTTLEVGEDGYFELAYAQEYDYVYQIARIYVESFEDIIEIDYKITGEVGLDFAIFSFPDYSFTSDDISGLGYTDEYDHYDYYSDDENDPYNAFFEPANEDPRIWQMVNAPGLAGYVAEGTVKYDLDYCGYLGGDSFCIDIIFVHLSSNPNRPDKASFWFKMDTQIVETNNTKTVTFGSSYGTLLTPVRTNMVFDGWFTAASGGTKITSTTTYSTVGNRTIYAHWSLISRTIYVHLRLINMDGSYTSTDNNVGGSVNVNRYVISGLTSAAETRLQTEAVYSYVVHASQRFQMTPKANSGYVYLGCSISSTPSNSIKTPTRAPSATYTSYPNSNYHYYIYFKKISQNQLKYDETEKYFYFEDGYYPQSNVSSIIGTDILEDCSGLNSDSSYSVDSNRHILTLNMNGNYDTIGRIALVDGAFNFAHGDVFGLNIKLVSGTVENPNSSCFQLNLNSDFDYAPISTNYVDAPLNQSSSSELVVGSDVDVSSCFLTLIIDCKGGLVFNNAVYEIEVVRKYDNLMTANGESFTYCDGSGEATIPVYSYNGEKYVKIEKNGTSAWFKFEPIRWRISDYGVKNTETNIERYTALLKFKGYASSSDNFVAVSDLILGVGAMHSTRTVQEGDSIEDMAGFQNIQNMTNSLSNDTLKTVYSRTGNVINVDSYSGYERGQANAVNKENTLVYSSAFRICSVAELDEVGFVNKGAKASDMVAFILGMDKDQVSYWTRDLSNLGAGVAITSTGTQIRPWLDEVLGMRFAYTFREGSNVAF